MVEVMTTLFREEAVRADVRILVVPLIAGNSRSLSLSSGLKWNGLATWQIPWTSTFSGVTKRATIQKVVKSPVNLHILHYK
jgi:hypothetical protein